MVEGLSDRDVQDCWDRSSAGYTGDNYAGIRTEIVEDLLEMGVLGGDVSVLDIGCGPGLYEPLIAPHARSVRCIDGSPGMTERARERCSELSNVEVRNVRWEDQGADDRFDVVFTSLCPALNNPESLMRMEAISDRHCVFISSANPRKGISAEVWSALGLDYSYNGYDTHYPCGYMRFMGREPELRFYCSTTHTENPLEEAVRMHTAEISRHHPLTGEQEEKVADIVRRHAVDGVVGEDRCLTIGMMVWRPCPVTPSSDKC